MITVSAAANHAMLVVGVSLWLRPRFLFGWFCFAFLEARRKSGGGFAFRCFFFGGVFVVILDLAYSGKLAMFGESVLGYLKTDRKAAARRQRRIWLGKSLVNDVHIVAQGAMHREPTCL